MDRLFTSLLPQFAGRRASFPVLLALGAIFAAMTLVGLSGYACAVASPRNFLRRAAIRRATQALTGTLLIALGVCLAAERAR
jgi:threonine/homoserine/homoserine lactone efflux protein